MQFSIVPIPPWELAPAMGSATHLGLHFGRELSVHLRHEPTGSVTSNSVQPMSCSGVYTPVVTRPSGA
jgi:hypothetical protein